MEVDAIEQQKKRRKIEDYWSDRRKVRCSVAVVGAAEEEDFVPEHQNISPSNHLISESALQ